MVNEPPASFELGVQTADLLQDMMERVEVSAAGYRDLNIPAGTVLGEQDVYGQQVRWTKPNSMVRAGKVPLPERFPAFDKFGNLSMLPTAQMGYMLGKERADAPGERAFHTHTRGMTRETCPICPAERKPIEALCPWCTGAKGLRNCFFSETDFYLHQRRFHEDEFTAQEQAMERAERREQMQLQRQTAEAMLAVAQHATPQPARMDPVTCEECGEEFANRRKLAGHRMGAHRKPNPEG